MKSDRVPVRFEGESSGVEELSWGQYELWSAMQRQASWLPIGAVTPLPAGTTVPDAVAELRFMLGRYQSLRTRLRFEPDGCRQVAARSGEVTLEIVDADDDADPAAVAGQVEQRYRDADYDFATEWPIRIAVVRHRGVLTHRVLIMCHLVTDSAGARVMLEELQVRAVRGPIGPVAAMQPLEQARWQRSRAGQRVSEGSLRRWESILRRIPARRFRGSGDPRQPRHWEARFDSTALLLGVRAIAARTRSSSALALLTLFAVMQARLTGIQPAVFQVVVNNRFRQGLARSVSVVGQTGLCALDLAGLTVDQAVVAARGPVMAAYKHAYYDRRRMEELLERVGKERGEQIDLACFYNDRRQRPGDETGAPPATPARLQAALAETTLEWLRRQDEPFERLFLHVEEVPDRVGLTILADTHHFAPADMTACVRGMEELAVAAAFDPAAPTRV